MTRVRRAAPAGTVGGALRVAAVLVVVLLAGVLAPTAAMGQVPAPVASGPVVLTLDGLSPRVVRPDGPAELVVSGRVRNTAAVAVRDLGLRVQRGPALGAERDVERALAGADPAEEVRPPFTQLAATLAPAEERTFVLRVPLRGSVDSLALTTPGIYPLLVNANGSAGDAAAQRLGAVRILLPVLGLPAVAPGVRPAPLPVPPAGRAERVAVLYPVADRPRRLPVSPGTAPLLADDDLAGSFAPGGRLAGLVDALGRAAPPGSPAAASVCLAVDADLLETAQAMATGYQVATATGPVPGRGSAAAAGWLTALRRQVAGRCVVAVPYADADLLATSRGNLTDLTTYARTRGARRVGDLLGVAPRPDTTWPAGGLLDERTVSDLATGGAQTLVVDGRTLTTDTPTPASGEDDGSGDDGRPPGAVARLAASGEAPLLAVATDPLVADALAGVPSVADGVGTSPAGTAAPLSVQDALATLVLRASARTGGGVAGAPEVTLVAPPLRWAAGAAGGTEAAALLDTVGDLARLGLASPVDLGTLVAGAAATAGPATLTTGELPAGPGDAGVARAREVRDEQRDLLAASQQDRAGSLSPAEFVDPLTGDLLRSLSAVTRDDPAARTAAVGAVGAQMDALRAAVRVVQPSGSYSLGSNDAPLLLTVDNRLPVAVDVAVTLAPTPGLRTAPVPVQDVVPAFGSRQFQVGIQVIRSGEFSVDAQARTPGGEPLGPPSRLLLRSTAYGTITVWLTASAALVLVVLASARIVRRVRASRRSSSGPDRRPPGAGPSSAGSGPPPRRLQNR